MKIQVNEYENYWQCAEKCCDNFVVVSVFTHEGKEYEYRSHDSEENLKQFLAEVLGIEFEMIYSFGEVTV